jgi:hypothetical protein
MAFLGTLGPIIAGAGAVVGAIGQYQSGMYQARVAANNAEIAEHNAEYARAAGAQQADIESRKNAARVGAIRAGLAANGVDVNSGSAVDVQAGERETGKLDVDTVLHNAELQAYGYTTQAANFRAQSEEDKSGAAIGLAGGLLKAGGGLLGDASSLSFKWGTTSDGRSGFTDDAEYRF